MNEAATSESVGTLDTMDCIAPSTALVLRFSFSHAARHRFSTTGNLLQNWFPEKLNWVQRNTKWNHFTENTYRIGENKNLEKTTVSWLLRIQRALILQPLGIGFSLWTGVDNQMDIWREKRRAGLFFFLDGREEQVLDVWSSAFNSGLTEAGF